MKLLILGGTVFLGRHLTEAALAHGHEVTLFHRGVHGNELFPTVERLHGDRAGDLSALQGREWDAVIDTSGQHPKHVRSSARLLSQAVKHYTFISSISVYADFSQPAMDESAPVGRLTPEQLTSIEQTDAPSLEFYGQLKALCEEAAEEEMPGRVCNVRPGLIVGPYDNSDRFTYWPGRVARGGEVLAPGRPDKQVQFIDVRDLAAWILHVAESSMTGVYNATGPAEILTMQHLLEECKMVSGSDAVFRWRDDVFLIDKGVDPWMGLPLWIPDSEKDMAGFLSANIQRARAAGLTFRPLSTTIKDTLAWDLTRPVGERRAGLKAEREAELLVMQP
ncbi:hypothetical protein KDA_62240 [Dictyobacter alpinus]|uniref:NAD-dependent epimerase/dehydratase domain-containing protein n=1 Tax=Dictyobacter alpinus TaxID=2014873 RepID=A0A402BHH2_9CHLR|nr:NAD-dependent epimerase/dehydratase family protein [Dictyobacter alpinus]GCE30740.1 hypothetical protein KDA_62240 [Dictyobacter alpinus]